MADSVTSSDRISALAEEFLARHRQGLRPSVEAYATAYPDLADEIRRLFPALLMMEELKPASGDVTGSFDVAAVVIRGARLQRLGDFRILREVGRGGMGVVYEAEQESLGRRVALKVLATHALKDSGHVQRFEREARSAARLHHTNIVPVFGVGEQDGLHYYVMQFIQGQALNDVIAELKRLRAAGSSPEPHEDPLAMSAAAGIALSLTSERFASALPPSDVPPVSGTVPTDGRVEPTPHARRAAATEPTAGGEPGTSSLSGASGDDRYWRGVARIGLQVARALEYAHSQGIFHRDVKPANLLLDAQGTAWVADFGLAKATEGDDLTHTGDIVGTIRYMAPERFEGRCDARADVYSLGLTLYEMLTLRPAFDRTDRQALIRQVMEDEPPRLRAHTPAVPRDLETIVHKAVARDPAGRYPTAGELAEDLELFLDGKPVRARQISVMERGWKWAKRRPVVAALLAGLVVTVLTGLGAVTWQWRDAVAARNEALIARDEARNTLKLANRAVNTYFAQVSEEQLLNEPGMQPLRKKLLEQALPYYRAFVAQKGDDPALRFDLANAYLRWGTIASNLGANEEAETNLKTAADQFGGLLRGESENLEAQVGLAMAHQALAEQWIFTDQFEAGRREAGLAIRSWDAVLASRHNHVQARRMLGRAYDLVGVSWGQVGDMKAAAQFFQRAIDVHTEVVRDAPDDIEAKRRLAGALSNLANAHRFNGWLTESERGDSRSVAILEPLATREGASLNLRKDLGRRMGNLGRVRLLKGALRDAEATLTESRRLLLQLVLENPTVPDYLSYLGDTDNSLGRVYAAQGRTARAEETLKEGLEYQKKLLVLNPKHQQGLSTNPEYCITLALLGGGGGRIQEALPLIREALRIQTEFHDRYPDSPDTLHGLTEALLASVSLDIVSGRPAVVDRIVKVRNLVGEWRRRVESDPNNLWACSEAVSGYLALAEHSLAFGTPVEAAKLLQEATTVLGHALEATPDLPIFHGLAVRLETANIEALMRLGKNEEATAAAKRAVSIGERLADQDPAYFVDLACARALQARLAPSEPASLAAAVSALRRAVEAGFDNAYKLENDHRLAPVLPRDESRALIRLMKPRTATHAARDAVPIP